MLGRQLDQLAEDSRVETVALHGQDMTIGLNTRDEYEEEYDKERSRNIRPTLAYSISKRDEANNMWQQELHAVVRLSSDVAYGVVRINRQNVRNASDVGERMALVRMGTNPNDRRAEDGRSVLVGFIDDSEITVGRGNRDNASKEKAYGLPTITDETVFGEHARISYTGGELVIKDRSPNGTSVLVGRVGAVDVNAQMPLEGLNWSVKSDALREMLEEFSGRSVDKSVAGLALSGSGVELEVEGVGGDSGTRVMSREELTTILEDEARNRPVEFEDVIRRASPWTFGKEPSGSRWRLAAGDGGNNTELPSDLRRQMDGIRELGDKDREE